MREALIGFLFGLVLMFALVNTLWDLGLASYGL